MNQYKFLNKIKSPDDVKKLSAQELVTLCAEIRDKMINTVAKNGGHLSSNLGVVELTVAMHRVFDSPRDQMVFDVGHQCYTHKLLTGRFDDFDTLRREGGIAGFTKPCESEHDIVISGHSSTSISSACGLAAAKTLAGKPGYVVAVIGDGALSGGLAYEGLNNAGRTKDRLIIVLNDNKMSISRNVGSMAKYLSSIRSKKSYINFKSDAGRVINKIPLIGSPIKRVLFKSKALLRYAIYHTTIFDDMGFAYLGPVDGHNVESLIEVFQTAKEIERPVIIHTYTVKGKGYTFAEQNPSAFHGVSGFDVETGEISRSSTSFSDVFGDEMCKIAAEDDKVCAITAAMKSGTGLSDFVKSYPDRLFDVGIAEQHAVTFAAGLAINGMKPVFAVYSSFLQRSYDQMLHDVSIGNVKTVLAIDRAGIVGEDGETHNGMFDIALLNTLPNMTVFAPTYFCELRAFLRDAIYNCDGPAAVRYPRGTESAMPDDFTPSLGSFDIYEGGKDKLIVTFGRIFSYAYDAEKKLCADGEKVSVLKLNRIKPIDPEAVKYALGFKKVFIFEEGVTQGGVGEHFEKLLYSQGYEGKAFITAADMPYVQHCSTESAMKKLGLDSHSIFSKVKMG
ncbi:MAG: 1-deoxy-D-xylulose-5-phosphate synthase [Clostridia bacterium]|nr:1-deoxy-D-xylulose-5-phosphate synthase [Clostridia bacterium]